LIPIKEFGGPARKQIPELQSLRGIAAAVVLFHHASFLFITGQSFHFWSEAIFNAHAAVMLFFVLSGYVLSGSLNKSRINLESVLNFCISRAFRIFPEIWAASMIAGLYLLFVHRSLPTVGESAWYARYFTSPPGIAGITKAFCCAGNALVPPMWSVRVELVASAASPFIVLAVRRGFGPFLLATSATLALAAGSTSLVYLLSFTLGVMASEFQGQIGKRIASWWTLLAATLLTLGFRLLSPAWRFDANYHALAPMLVESAASALLIMSIVARAPAFLRSTALTRLGDLSYSLYLIHFAVMSALAKGIGLLPYSGDVQAVILIASTFGATLPLAHLSYEWIERPGISIGKRFLAGLKARRLRITAVV
jgi:peptidoglycan/LPS O-acetylase OafA/YrhL